MEILEIYVGKDENNLEYRTVAVGKGKIPAGCDFMLTAAEFKDLVEGEPIGVTGILYFGVAEKEIPKAKSKPYPRWLQGIFWACVSYAVFLLFAYL